MPAPRRKRPKAKPAAQKRREGRPSRLEEPAVRERILTSISAGLPKRTAAVAAGVTESMFHKWIRLADEAEAAGRSSTFLEFRQSLEKAEAVAQEGYLQVIQKAAKTGGIWTAAAWFLERRHPETYGRLDRSKIDLKVDGKLDHHHAIDLAAYSDDELAQLDVLLAKSLPKGEGDGE